MQQYLFTMLLTVFYTGFLSYFYFWKFKTVKNGEDFDGDVRRTIFGLMFIYHAWTPTWWRHFRFNWKVYLKTLIQCWVWCGLWLLTIECLK